MADPVRATQVAVIGGGQSGLAAGYFLRRAGLDFVILDAQPMPGGAWQHGWDSLRLFSPAQHSPLPGWPMPPFPGAGYPTAGHVVDYLSAYEKRYDLPVHRPVHVHAVHRGEDGLLVDTDTGTWTARAVISATGTWWRPFRPSVPGQREFRGRQLHTVDYRSPNEFAGNRVVVVGGGNSAAQIAADLAEHTTLRWVTRRPPRYLPDHIDGRALFDIATRRRTALHHGDIDDGGIAALGDIVAVPPVRALRDQGLLHAKPMFTHLTPEGPVWTDGTSEPADAIIWCTGFRPSLTHLAPLRLSRTEGHVRTEGTRAADEPRLHLLGYGDWTGPASATLLGVGMTARAAVTDIANHLRSWSDIVGRHQREIPSRAREVDIR